MFKIFLVIFLIFSININSQVDGTTCVWTGDNYQTNTNWGNPLNWDECNGGYPSGSSAIAIVKSGNSVNKTITLDRDITLKQFKHGGSHGGAWTLAQSSGGSNTLTLEGTGVGQVWQHNREDVHWTIGANITIDADTNSSSTEEFKLGTSSHSNNSITFSNASTLTLSSDTSLRFVFDKDGHTVTFNGTITGGSGRDIIFKDFHTVTFGSSVVMTGYLGDLDFFATQNDGSGTGTSTSGGVTVNGDVRAREVHLGSSDLTINTSGNLTCTRDSSAASTLRTDGTGKFIVKASRTASASLIAKFATGSPNIRFDRETDGDNEWTLIGVPVVGEVVSDITGLRAGSGSHTGKVAIGYFDNSLNNGEYVYYNSGATNELELGKGYLISPDGNGVQTISFTGTGYFSSTLVQEPVTDESGTYGNWNLVGNPYLSYLMLTDNVDDSNDSFLEINKGNIDNSAEAVYAWDGAEWDIYNKTSNTVNHIAPGEGFFIYARSGGTNMNMNFKEDMQKTGKGSNFNASMVNGGDDKNISSLNLRIEDLENGDSDKIRLYFNNACSRGLDPGYDARKFFVKNSIRVFTSLLDEDKGIKFGIQALPFSDLKNVIVPLGINTTSSKIKFSVYDRDLSHLYNIFLEDRLLNKIMKLDNPIEISLDEKENGLGRFYLHFTDGMIPEITTDDELRIFKSSENSIRIMGQSEKTYKAKIYDFSGRLINFKEFKHYSYFNDIDVKSINILKIESDNKTVIKKFKIE